MSEHRFEATRPLAEGRLVSRAVEVPEPPVPWSLPGRPPRIMWAPPGDPTVAAAGAAASLTARGGDRLGAIREAAAEVFEDPDVPRTIHHAARPRLFGGCAFHDDHAGTPPWEQFPAALFVLPRLQLARTGGGAWLTANAYGPEATPEDLQDRLDDAREQLDSAPGPDAGEPPGVASTARTTTKSAWREAVRRALDRIESGRLRKVVLAQSLRARLDRPVDLPSTLSRLGERYPDCFRFLLAPADDSTFFGATPERLVSCRGRTVETGALAGSIERGDTPEEDEALAAELDESDKNAHEHELVIDAIREQLAPLAASVTTGPRRVRRLASVQHLQTPVRARLDRDRHVLSLVEALHPTPAVGGLPPAAALETIREAESFDRGWYAAPVGWFDARGNGEFAVGIRSVVASGREATLFAGAGIVADSVPEREWDEVQLKYRPILDALAR